MKANFKSVQVQPTLSGAVEAIDLSQVIAEAVYQNASTFEQHKLAHRIAETDGEVELSDADAATIKAAISHFKFFVQKPVLEMFGEKFE